MPNGPQPRIKFYTLPQTWYGRLLGAVVGAVLLLLAIFFFTFFIIIFVVAAIAMTVYLSLFGRRYEEPTSPDTIRPDVIRVENLLELNEDESEKVDSNKG
jgi:membrane protein implicated in regulation of membrane protease activity